MDEKRKDTFVSKAMVALFVFCMIVPAAGLIGAVPAMASTSDAMDAVPGHSTKLYLMYGNFDTRSGEPDMPNSMQAQELQANDKGAFIVQANGLVTEEWKTELQQNGAEIISYIPDNAVLVRTSGRDVGSIKSLDSVGWMGEFHPAYKISPNLNGVNGRVTVDISHFTHGSNGPTVRMLKTMNVDFVQVIKSDVTNNIKVTMDAADLATVARLNDVHWIEVAPQYEMLNNDATQLLQSGSTTGGRALEDQGLTGEGYIACVCDSGIRTTHENIREAGKVVDNYVPPNGGGELGYAENNEHGMHVQGSVLGDMTPYGTGYGSTADGGAPSAQLIFQDIGLNVVDDYVYPSGDLYNDHFLLAQYGDATHNGGAILHTNSWGGAPGYNSETSNIDQYVWDNKDFLLLFAAGNDGTAAYTLDNQAEAKNVIGVASTVSAGTSISTFSSRGPTLGDDRIKPDIAAPGESVYSSGCRRDNNYYTSQGTSMATPLAAGTMVLMHEYYDSGWYPTGTQVAGNGFAPSAALLKATALAGAVDIGTLDIPNYAEGWGRMHGENSLYFAGDSKELKVYDNTFGLLNGQSITYNIGVSDSDGAEPLKIFMVYSDYKGDPAASVRLVNDLNMNVVVPGGTTYYNNNFAGGQSTTGVYDDDLNNVRAVVRNAPANGVYTITITAENVAYGPQPFALVINGPLDRGYGTVTVDKTVYGPGENMDIVVEDLNNPASSINALVTNSVAGDQETVVLTATDVNSGVFVGTLPIALGNVNQENGILQVSHGETITVAYGDTNPTHTATATALVDAAGPVIYDIWFSDTSATATVVHWKTDENANSTIYYQQTEPSVGPWQASSQSDLALKHDIPLQGLEPGSTYVLDIASSDANGVETRDDNGGYHYTITTLSATGGTMVLYVDDDDGTSSELVGMGFQEDWKNNLDAYGWSYTHWDYKILGTPQIADMNAHQMVVWVVNEGYPQLDSIDRGALENYIDQSGVVPRLYMAGQDVGWDLGPDGTPQGTDPTFLAAYLRAVYIIDDASYGTQGVEEDPFQVMDMGHSLNDVWNLNNIDLEVDCYDVAPYANDRFWPDDLNPTNGGIACMRYSNNPTSTAAAIAYSGANYGGGTYNLVYSGFAPDMISSTNNGVNDYAPPAVDQERSRYLDEIIIYLLGGDHADIVLTYPTGGETLSGTETITWTAAGNPDNINIQISPNGGGAWEDLVTLAGTATNYNWNTALYDDGALYQVKVVGITNVPGVTLTGEDRSENVTLNNGIDSIGPIVQAGSLTIDPNPTYGTDGTLEATFSDQAFGNSGITNAQYRLDSGGWVAMSGVSGVGTSLATFDATLSAPAGIGDHLIEVQARDDMNNWGPIDDITWSRYTLSFGSPPVAAAGVDQNGVVAYNCQFDGSGTTEPDGDPITYTWTFTYDGSPQVLNGVNPTFLFEIPGNYEVTLTASDVDGSDQDTMWVNVVYANHNIVLANGWNFISYNVDTDGRGLANVFADQWATINSIMVYDGLNSEWQIYDKAAPAWMNSLTSTDRTQGIWLHHSGIGVLTIEGMQVTSTTVDLYAGWNMVGYPSNTADTASNVLVGTSYDGLQNYDNGAAYLISDMLGTENMVAGAGYWVHVPGDTSYVVTY